MRRPGLRSFLPLCLLTAGLAAAVLAAPAVPTAAAAAPNAPAPADFGSEIELTPMAEPAGAYDCRIVVRDLATDEVIAAPRIRFLRGEPASVETQLEGSERRITIEVEVAADRPTATYQVTVSDGERTVGRHKATVSVE